MESSIIDEKKNINTSMNHVDLYSNDQKGQKYYNRLVLQSNLQVPDHERIGVYSNH